MGYNTVVMLLNDMHHEWPDELKVATFSRGRKWFLYGQVLSEDHADGVQIVAVSGNTGQRLTPFSEVNREYLEALMYILQGHGYAVRSPGKTRAESPLAYGYHAENEARLKRERAEEMQTDKSTGVANDAKV